MSSAREELRVRAVVEAYLGEPVESLEVVPDPWVDKVFAVRAVVAGAPLEFLIHADGEVEDVEFKTWPPRSRT